MTHSTGPLFYALVSRPPYNYPTRNFIMKWQQLVWLTLFVWVGTAGSAEGPSDQEIIDQIYRHVSDFEQQYPGTQINRTMTVRELDPKSGELKKTSISQEEVWTRVGERPRIKILRCTVDGQTREPEACKRKERDRKAPYRIFGPGGRDHYRLKLTARPGVADASTFKLEVIPRERTSRHFQGILEFSADGFRLLSSRGTIADYPLGLKEFSLELDFAELNGHPVPARSKIDLTLYLPLVLNTRVISEAVASNQRLLTQ